MSIPTGALVFGAVAAVVLLGVVIFAADRRRKR